MTQSGGGRTKESLLDTLQGGGRQDSVRAREGETGGRDVGAAASGGGEAVWECGKCSGLGSCVQV